MVSLCVAVQAEKQALLRFAHKRVHEVFEQSLAATFLLRHIVLVLVVRESILALARAEPTLSASQFRRANATRSFHMTSKVGLQAYHTQGSGLT